MCGETRRRAALGDEFDRGGHSFSPPPETARSTAFSSADPVGAALPKRKSPQKDRTCKRYLRYSRNYGYRIMGRGFTRAVFALRSGFFGPSTGATGLQTRYVPQVFVFSRAGHPPFRCRPERRRYSPDVLRVSPRLTTGRLVRQRSIGTAIPPGCTSPRLCGSDALSAS